MAGLFISKNAKFYDEDDKEDDTIDDDSQIYKKKNKQILNEINGNIREHDTMVTDVTSSV